MRNCWARWSAIGYGTAQKNRFDSSITAISAEINASKDYDTHTTILYALLAKLPGVSRVITIWLVSLRSWAIQFVRGGSSTASNNPLIVIIGVS